MRIVFLSYNYSADVNSPAAWFERLSYYVPWLEILAKDHTVIRVDHINFSGSVRHNGVHYHFIGNGKPGHFPRHLHKLVKSLFPDVVVVSSFQFPLQLIQLRRTLGKKVRIIVQNHAERPATGIKKYVQSLASKSVNNFLFASIETGNEWKQKGNIASSAHVAQLMEVSSLFNSRDKPSCDPSYNFLWVGRLNPNKDPLTVVRVFLQFARQNDNVRLYMIYQTEELLQEIKNILPSSSPVMLLGKIPHYELQRWYNEAHFFVSASHYEGSGTALCEAMSCGCVPVVTNIPSFRSMVRECGFFYEPGKEDSLLAALEHALISYDHAAVEKVKEQFKEHLSFEAIAQSFQELLSEQTKSESTLRQTSFIG